MHVRMCGYVCVDNSRLQGVRDQVKLDRTGQPAADDCPHSGGGSQVKFRLAEAGACRSGCPQYVCYLSAVPGDTEAGVASQPLVLVLRV